MTLAALDSTGYRIVLVLHILSVVVGLGAVLADAPIREGRPGGHHAPAAHPALAHQADMAGDGGGLDGQIDDFMGGVDPPAVHGLAAVGAHILRMRHDGGRHGHARAPIPPVPAFTLRLGRGLRRFGLRPRRGIAALGHLLPQSRVLLPQGGHFGLQAGQRLAELP